MRKTLFWIHLVCGLVVGLFVALMAATGAALAFEDELVAWSERDARRVVQPAPDAPRLGVDALREKLRQARPDLKDVGVTIHRDPTMAVTFSSDKEAFFLNPWTGEVRQPRSRGMAHTMDTLTGLHRWLALKDEARATGRAITGAVNLAFLGLVLTGLVIWWPRKWTKPALRMLAVPSLRLKGKVRDFNWHNAFGLWSLPVLAVLCLTAIPISYRWGGELVYRLAGDRMPEGGRGREAGPKVEPMADLPLLTPEPVLAKAQQDFPTWERLSLRSGGNRGRGREGKEPKGPQPLMLMVKEAGAWPRTASTMVTLNPYTGEVMKRAAHADGTPGARLRHWTRFLHTGQALGPVGQALALLGCLVALVLVWTGFALSWRRFFARKPAVEPQEAPLPDTETLLA